MSEEQKRMTDEQFQKHAEAEQACESITAISPELLSLLTVEEKKPRKSRRAKPVEEAKTVEVPVKVKRTRKAKVVVEAAPEIISFKCKSCDELITSENVMKIGAGKDRYAAFCPSCQRSLGFIDEVFQTKVRHLIKTNATQGK